MLKLAVFDLRLHYPPQGGACVDLFSSLAILKKDFDIKIFTLDKGENQFSCEPPLPVEKISIPDGLSRDDAVNLIKETVLEWRPDCVFIADGWTLKPYIAAAFVGEVPLVVRLYAYEMLCPRNNEKWLFDHPCSSDALSDCGKCLECAGAYAALVREKRNGASNPLINEAEYADIYDGSYSERIRKVFSCATVITYNNFTAEIIRRHIRKPDIHIVPGGFSPEMLPERRKEDDLGDLFRIFVPGRMNDSAKGAASAIKAGVLFSERNVDFRMSVTMNPSEHSYPWLEQCSWLSHEETLKRMREADLVIVPSLWEEAFGMTWVEAMASGTAVISSNVAGPAEYTEGHALLFSPGDATELAALIEKLYSDPESRKKLALSGASYARNRFTWYNAAGLSRQAVFSAVYRRNKSFS